MKITDSRRLPRVDLDVPVFGLGCAQLGGLYRAITDERATALVRAAWDAGVRHFDTAPFYGYTLSERRLGVALRTLARGDYVLSTKAGRLMHPDASVQPGDDGFAAPLPFRPYYDYSYGGILLSFEESLRRLGVDRVDILYVHDIGSATHGDLHEQHWRRLTEGGGFRALDELRRSGCVRAVGLGVNEWQVMHQAMQEFDLDISMLAGRYTLLEQSSLSPLLEACVKSGHAIVVAGPFNSGVLAGGDTFNYGAVPPKVAQRVQALRAVCDEFDVPLPAAALQFPLAHPAVVSCFAGAHDATQLKQNIAWLQMRLPEEFWRALCQRGLVDECAPLPLVAEA